MHQHDFSQLFERYPAIISQMPDKFDSHQFILRLTQENQKHDIGALSLSRFQRASSTVYGRAWNIGKAFE